MSGNSDSFDNRSFFDQAIRIFGTTNHYVIGKLYLSFAFINFIMAGILAMIMRSVMFNPAGESSGLGAIARGFVDPETYNRLFTTHGTIMIFFVIFPTAIGFANYMVPPLIGAKDLYWPRWNNLAFWMLVPSALMVWVGFADVGWTGYAPYSTQYAAADQRVILWAGGLLMAGVSSIIGAVNLVMTIIHMRRPGLSWKKVDLFTYSVLFGQIIQLFATPVVASGLIMIIFDRILGADWLAAEAHTSPPSIGQEVIGVNGPILYQHIFWGYGHPAVYIIILPAMGLTSLLISTFSRNKVFGYPSMALSMFTIMFLSFYVWMHHMFTIGAGQVFLLLFSASTFIIAVPSGIKTFNWLMTMYGGEIKMEIPFLFAVTFLIGFILGGSSGVFNAVVPLDLVVHDTYWIVGHFHLIIVGGAVSAFFGAFYYLFPHMTGKMYNQKLAYGHWVLWTIGGWITYIGMHIVGLYGMPRRYYSYDVIADRKVLFGMSVTLWQQIISAGAFIMGFSILLLLINIIWTISNGEPAGDDPFGLGQKSWAWEENSSFRVDLGDVLEEETK